MIPVIVDTSDTETLGWQIASEGESAVVVVCWMDTQTVDTYPLSEVRKATGEEIAWYLGRQSRSWTIRGAAFALGQVIDRSLTWIPDSEVTTGLADEIVAMATL